jgi:SAM-dependent methyltransferase
MNTYTNMSYREIADRYNAINALPPHAAQGIGKAIAQATPGKRVLDMGAGALRLSIPAAQAGCEVTALDLEPAMLDASLREARLLGVQVRAVQGNVLDMPFDDGEFDAVMINNVLHQVPAWEDALREARRVMRRDGVLLQGRDWLDPQSCAGLMRSKWREIVASLNPAMRPTAAAGPALFQALAKMGGATSGETVAGEWTECLSPALILNRMRIRMHNETWSLSDDVMDAGLPQLTTWATQTWPNLNAEEQVQWRFMLSVTTWKNGEGEKE